MVEEQHHMHDAVFEIYTNSQKSVKFRFSKKNLKLFNYTNLLYRFD